MSHFTWKEEHLNLLMRVVQKRFAMNSVAGHVVPLSTIESGKRSVSSNRFDYTKQIVIDSENLELHEPFAKCDFTLAQVTEFSLLEGEMLTDEKAMQTSIATTITRAASALARWHDYLFFVGPPDKQGNPALPTGVSGRIGSNDKISTGLRQAAIQVEKELNNNKESPIVVTGPAYNEGLVAAVNKAILKLEERGYYTTYHLILGENLWQELHRPTSGSMVLPRERVEPIILCGDKCGNIHKTTTLPADEALIISLDGPTIDCVIAGKLEHYPSFEILHDKEANTGEILYQARVVEQFVPRIRENRAIVRLKMEAGQAGGPNG
jgi:hypothetical protein